MSPKRTIGDQLNVVRKTSLTKDGLISNYNNAFSFRPSIPFLKAAIRAAPFFNLNDKIPVLLSMLLGFQHTLAMLAGIITSLLILTSEDVVNLDVEHQPYLASTSLIVCSILSCS
jgi:hypothetical protein